MLSFLVIHSDNDNENDEFDEFVGTVPLSLVFKSDTDDALLLLLLQMALVFGNFGDKNT